ncbi:hypothetical protein [Actinoplanes friuliensis]|uniref:Putative 5'-nucleotidase n=1 Tax=Actinoplanes friuliensis DSM 7358 TaxID=1246995 RepID=U5WB62_9ACTN|nr:hypothetical protein [Actinoplanes friuliensis]AGZ46384.1 putative 5'-nucleotidase [Actinoplanes friuliensis DSM 7358]
MDSVRPRGLAALLTLALGAGTVAGAGLLGSPAWAAGPLSGTYSLDSTSIWTAQQVTLTQTALEDETPDTAVERTVDWGDGTVQTLSADAVKAVHKYPANGSYAVKVSLKDGDATADGTISNATSTVTVATAGGTYKFNPTWNWTWAGGGYNAKYELSGVPANATRVWVNWGDGETSLLTRSTTSTYHYYGFGQYTATVTLENAQGKTVPKAAGWYSTVADESSPSATLTVPSSPSKASSWSTVKGTAKDLQIGIDAVGVQLWRWTSSSDYYYNFSTKKWVKFNPDSTTVPNAALSWRPVDSKGNWSVGVSGMAKGYTIEVDYAAVDRAGNYSAWKYKVQKLTS